MPGTPVSASDDAVVVVDYKAAAVPDAATRNCCRGQESAKGSLLIEQLLAQLREAFQAEKDAGFKIDNNQDPVSFERLNDRVQELLKSYTLRNPGDWKRFALFNDVHYVRNLVEANDDFELIVLCWKAGQVSRVHNHAASHCWLAVLDGEMREVQYQRADPSGEPLPPGGGDEQQGSSVFVEAKEVHDMKIGDVGYINDHLALHSVGCYMDSEALDSCNKGRGANDWQLQGGVTVHLYSPPIRRVKIYEDNTVSERTPGFYSKGGVRV